MEHVNLPQITAADAAVSPTDLVVTVVGRTTRRVILTSALNALTNLDVGTVFVLENHSVPQNNGVYRVNEEVSANGQYVASKQGDGPDPVTAPAEAATVTTTRFAKKIDAEDGVSIQTANVGAFSLQPMHSVDGESWANLGSAISAAGVTAVAGKIGWLRLSVASVGTSLDVDILI